MDFNYSSFSNTSTAALDEEELKGDALLEEDMVDRTSFVHKSVMLKEVISFLNLKSGDIVVDATVGLGGHSLEIAKNIEPKGTLIAIDKDEEALKYTAKNLKRFSKNCVFVNDDFRNLDKILEKNAIDGISSILFDLGVSSLQLDDVSRGFSFRGDGPLDMRMDKKSYISAYDLLNNLTEEEIASILYRFGQERFSRRIAKEIVQARRRAPISSTQELADIVTRSLPGKMRRQKIHPATRTFQALRIAVNRELEALEEALQKAAGLLKKKGRICVISFHSLEDKIVKETFRGLVKTNRFKLIFKKILVPTFDEVMENPRARSAKMRVIERVK